MTDNRPTVDWRQRAACATDRGRALVDASVVSKSITANRELAQLCVSCPVREECLAEAMTHRSVGMWATTTLTQRTKHRRRASA